MRSAAVAAAAAAVAAMHELATAAHRSKRQQEVTNAPARPSPPHMREAMMRPTGEMRQ